MRVTDKDYKRNQNDRRRKGNKNKNTSKGDDYMNSDIKDAQGSSAEGKDSKHEVFNDLRWYVVSDQILNDAARIPYNIPVGVPFIRDGKFAYPEEGFTPHDFDDAIPGIMVSSLMPMLGETGDGPSAPVNIAANSLFQKVRSKISGTRTYISVDMMLYMGAMDSLYCYLTWLTRLYATAYTYHQANRYLSRSIIEAQNVDYDDLIDKLTYFRTKINLSIAKVRALYLPSVLPIFLRHSWMFSHYFIEGENEKDQIYLHMPAGYHYFTKDDNGWGMLDSVCLDDRRQRLTVNKLLAALDQMVDPIYDDEDFNRISGDMLKTYEGKVFSLSEIPDIVTVKFAYSEEVLLQFKNAKYKQIPCKDNAYNTWESPFFNYYQNNRGTLLMMGSDDNYNYGLYNYIYVSSGQNKVGISGKSATGLAAMCNLAMFHEWSKDTLLTSPHADVVPGENMINTRLTVGILAQASSSTPGYTEPDFTFGSEWPVCYYLFSHHKDKATGTMSMFGYRYDRVLFANYAHAATIRNVAASQLPIRSAFKYLPELTIIELNATEGSEHVYESGRSIFEVDNYALVNYTTVDGMHRAAILGEYNIPELAVQ